MKELSSYLAWTLIPASMAFVGVFLYHFFRDPFVEIKPEVMEVRTCGYYERMLGGHSEGDKEVTIEVTLVPSKEVEINAMHLKVHRKSFSALEWKIPEGKFEPFAPRVIDTTQIYTLVFYVTGGLPIGERNSRLIVTINKIKHSSKPLIINKVSYEGLHRDA